MGEYSVVAVICKETCKAGFLNLDMIAIMARKLVGAVLFIIAYSAASLTSTQKMPGATSPPQL